MIVTPGAATVETKNRKLSSNGPIYEGLGYRSSSKCQLLIINHNYQNLIEVSIMSTNVHHGLINSWMMPNR